MRLQDKILKKVEKLATDAGLDFVHNPQYANCGLVMIQDDDFHTVVAFGYHFQSGHNSLSVKEGKAEGAWFSDTDGDKIRAFLAGLEGALKAHAA